jgi:Flp pilus assembly protein TadB
MKFYSETQVKLATFLGSPLAGGFLMAQNERNAGQSKRANRLFVISVAATLVLFLVVWFLPKRLPGNYFIPLLCAIVVGFWYRREQGDLLTGDRFPGAVRESWWATLGYSLLVAIFVAAMFVAVVLALVAFRGTHA